MKPVIFFKKIIRKFFLKKEKNLLLNLSNNRRGLTRNQFLLSRPSTSENIWRKLSGFYLSLSKPPRILEYGSGISTFYHFESLRKKNGGELVSVEHSLDWYYKLKNSFQAIYSSEIPDFQETTKTDINQKKINWSFSIPFSFSENKNNLIFQYLYRPAQGRTGCGTFKEFKEYVTAPSGKFDVIIIDGRARKACIQYVLKNQLLSENGLLVLFEAGRGSSLWPKKDQLTSIYNYQPEVDILLKMGAELVDGNGFERWENWIPNRPKHKYFSDHCPGEACFWYKETIKNNGLEKPI